MEWDEAARIVRSLYLACYTSAVRYAHRISGSLELAEDVVQDTFKALYMELISDADVKDAKQWIFRTLRREVQKHQGRQRRRHENLEPVDVEDLPDRRTTDGGSGWDWDEVTRLFSVLTSREEEALLLRLQGFRYREVAIELNISVNSVKTLLARGLRKLQARARALAGDSGIAHDHGIDTSKTLQ